jgi:GNAT superfamily N-acetyltransferase
LFQKGCYKEAVWVFIFFGGDRLSCVDEAVVIKHEGQIVSLASIAPEGEWGSGEPTIVGLYTMPDYRLRGLGATVMEAAVRRCQARGLTPVSVAILSQEVKKLIDKLPQNIKQHLKNHSRGSQY